MLQESTLWYIFAAIVIVLLAADLWINRKPHHIPFKSAVKQLAVWVGVALAFGVLVFLATDMTHTIEYYTAYAIEEAMSMDNLFVFIIIFAYFGIKDEDQHHALFYGVIGAIVFRAIFIFAGVELLERFDWLLYVFGVILLVVALKTTFGKDDDQKENGIAKFMKNRFNYVDDEASRGKMFARVNGKRVITVLFLCVIVIELTDIVFALDSIPAVNIFAVMGLRSLFFVIHGGMQSLRYLKYGLGIILLFVAFKLLAHHFIDIPVLLSLVVIVGVLAVTVVASVMKNKSDAKKVQSQ